MPTFGGSCLCGAVAFAVTEAPRRVTMCHCSRCRKARGTGHAVNGIVPWAALVFERGESELTTYRVPHAKHFAHVFCQRCGASMPRKDDRGFWIVPFGAFDDDPGVKPERHIWTDDKAPWETINDDLPQCAGAPPPL